MDFKQGDWAIRTDKAEYARQVTGVFCAQSIPQRVRFSDGMYVPIDSLRLATEQEIMLAVLAGNV